MTTIRELDNGEIIFNPYGFKPSPSIDNDKEKAYLNTIEGTARLMKMPNVSQEDIDIGLEINATKLGISVESLRSQAQELIIQESEQDSQEPSTTTSPQM